MPKEYGIALLNRRGLEMAGAQVTCFDDLEAEIEADEIGSQKQWCVRAVLHDKAEDRYWSIPVGGET